MAITETKRQQMGFAANVFLKYNKQFSELNPLLAVAEVVGDDFAVKNWFSLGF